MSTYQGDMNWLDTERMGAKLAGLTREKRHELFVKLRHQLVNSTTPLTFVWRRNSAKEPVLDAQGQPVAVTAGNPPHVVMTGNPPHPKIKTKFYATQHTIDAFLTLQKP